ncbi:MAG: restriction endonuclease subunit S [Oscillospiraceae bacterium]|nr:restriction endonuclease subunit S [Oscillospiraceae bacterium]
MDIRLENVLKYEQPTKYIVKSENYSDDFVLPVLTAGKSFVLGYTDETEGVCKASENPVIIFDDFTADCKYVDFDFKVKSSAMKILHKVNAEDNLKYYFYAMQAIDYTPFSHKRVWISEYSKFKIKNRSVAEQNNIVKELDTVAAAIDNAKQRLNALDELVKSRFIEMFGDPVENPKGWDKRPLSDECEIITGNTPSRKKPNYYGDFIEWIKSDNINTPNALLTPAIESLSEEGLKVGRSVEKDCILMTCIAGSIGCIGNVSVTDRKVAFNQQINGIIPNKNNVWFLYVLFDLSKSYIQSTVTMALKGILSKGQLSKIEFIFPPIELQNEFAKFVELTDKSKFIVQKQIEDLQELLDSKMDEYFG